ncbi:PREDICTED: uncharacterized protein LOC107331961 [Acropora digitifera]|uniref:uncharacterized protein LOC107331961 n=1 Tax=Acropora digitifera TaxID=70779 RepID=UPI00077ADFF3|nr:PREDICTED: uncharacterized protein LOC107331961 [Acropora digitifera]
MPSSSSYLTMKELSFLLFVYSFCFINVVNAIFSFEGIRFFEVFLKPYGITFHDDIFRKVSQNLEDCPTFTKAFQGCNAVFDNLTSSSMKNEISKLEFLSENFSSKSYGCFRNKLKSQDYQLSKEKKWFADISDAMNHVCREKCWETLEQQINQCIQLPKWGIQDSDITYVRFVTEVFKSQCSQDDSKLFCFDKFINELQNNSSPGGLKTFFDNLNCCIGSVLKIMKCYRFIPCASIPKPSLSSPATSTISSVTGKQIAGITLASVICLGVAIIVGNYFYHRWKKKAKVRFEDYGYSRLKMLEDEFYFDVEIDDGDDKSTGLVQI